MDHIGDVLEGDKYCSHRGECIRCKLIDLGHIGYKPSGQVHCSLASICPYCLFLKERFESVYASRMYAERIRRNI
jgi:hypothetical protein